MTMRLLVHYICPLLVVVLFGCPATQQLDNAQPAGFLKDYSKLRPGGEGNPILFYRNPKTDFLAYDKVLVEPVVIWPAKGTNLDNVPKKEREHLALLLQVKILEAVRAEGLGVVRNPGPRVMRIRAAITEAEQSSTAGEVVTNVLPVPGGKKMAAGTRSLVGAAGLEAEMTDSQSGELLMAGVDRRGGGRTFQDAKNPWNDVEKAFQYWSDRFRQRLCEERTGEFCVPAE